MSKIGDALRDAVNCNEFRICNESAIDVFPLPIGSIVEYHASENLVPPGAANPARIIFSVNSAPPQHDPIMSDNPMAVSGLPINASHPAFFTAAAIVPGGAGLALIFLSTAGRRCARMDNVTNDEPDNQGRPVSIVLGPPRP